MGAGALAGAGEDSGAGAWLAMGWRGDALVALAVLVASALLGLGGAPAELGLDTLEADGDWLLKLVPALPEADCGV
ncbi:hypothetical protein MOBUDSM44075_04788 [Mycolicibacterium obuense]|uniref:Uncharacterized protein n=1 Tax=Mycolicibacterium obuense TaxID=1807 RepID=A0A0J6VID7_9MYCO|nr:hypothetical protein MOBUDSM44075_04788 [Mycolicibacterium obuense]